MRNRTLASIPKWLQYVGVMFAGSASFIFAAQVSNPGPDNGGIELTDRRERSARAPASPEVADIPAGGEANGMPGYDRAPRLFAGVAQSPFDALNVSANTAAPQPLPALVDQPSAKRSSKKATETKPPNPEPLPPPPAPVAPPLPFTVIGSIQSPRIGEGKQLAFLNHQGAMIVARAGDVIGAYRVDDVSVKAVEFIYLPLKQRQTLHIVN